MTRVVYLTLGALIVGSVLFVVTHLGAYPWIGQTWWFEALAMFVLLNTLAYALLAAVKMGWQLGRKYAASGSANSGDGGSAPGPQERISHP